MTLQQTRAPERVESSTPAPPEVGRPRQARRRFWSFRTLLLMLVPGLLYLAVYKYGPMYGVLIAFKDYSIREGIAGSPWASPFYTHFEQFWTSPYFSTLMTNTVLISVYKLVAGTIPPIIVALLFNECRLRWFRRLAQTVSYMPHFLSWVIVYGVTIALLSQSTGLVNGFLRDNFGFTIGFLTSNTWFRSVLVGSDLWKDIGWGAIIYLAAMIGIDRTFYEAARVDGAGRFRQIWHITLPGIRPVIILLLVLKLGNILDAGFDQVYIFYNIQVYPTGDIIDTWVYRAGLENLNYSLAAAVGLFKSVIGLVLIVVANRIARRWSAQLW
ncbi:binding-protein-dependent transport systems inner membrane component [Beutenbergia cavernae DSM 12333]|uniref:Binding-protein-dependent transport systems inner membrane component n=1 Tax=Beutenbergia cavernae (strain ATCC BAA-8 / DSM 12333 / CCUG 43141 / JCM 11478 / NBRC 16432 / NCIMB 13614 / HKI 0122) TaxID=471853 RepID=C5C500_BEUC1|nr:ABC transporter permease subunit [Beutenbergia cavernae]ACQ80128.1 binding-protein-dependent transport systems inner membrane component [Beutenbergia cavernae DSM 12333]